MVRRPRKAAKNGRRIADDRDMEEDVEEVLVDALKCIYCVERSIMYGKGTF